MKEIEDRNSQDKELINPKGILNYKNKGSQSVFRLFGIELTAPSGLKNPGTVYISFILVNLIIFLVLRSFVTG
ncbi:hypothetical protein [Prochlorococcus sp. MIT 1223]|uniref:hypothetical protein n=1 Tax=Prochlorococcus sp. MIT 1223 TaxID=3096217 RepID=UPI002A75F6F7|nr:hypothetical protein [Prochlorococcus sp. MIT 1223]